LVQVTPVLDRIVRTLGLVDPSGAVLVDDRDAATVTIDEMREYSGKCQSSLPA
jgi:hypothetical protein